MGGPISVADYMRSCLQFPNIGYYSREIIHATSSHSASSSPSSSSSSAALSKSNLPPNAANTANAILGSRGDFTTSPEISQLFGELVGVWLVATHQNLVESGALSDQSPIAIAEIGPGRGTLINDALRSISKFSKTRRVLKALHLIETSSVLRQEQAKTLHCTDVSLASTTINTPILDIETTTTTTTTTATTTTTTGNNQTTSSSSSSLDREVTQQTIGSLGYIPSLPVLWHSSLDSVPTTLGDYSSTAFSAGASILNHPPSQPVATFFVCHELFDALPVHQLVWKGDQEAGMWIERLVDNIPRTDVKDASVTSSTLKDSSAEISSPSTTEDKTSSKEDIAHSSSSSPPSSLPSFRMVLSTSPTPASVAYTAHERAMREASSTVDRQVLKRSEGDVAEYSPESVKLAYSLALRVKKCSGAALIVDYGGNAPSGAWTLRGIRKHEFVNPLSSPGDTDLSCDVDFASLAFAVAGSAGSGSEAKAVGPVTQGAFLQRMGIRERLERLLLACGTSPEADNEKSRLISEAQRLVDPNDMGNLYKVLAIVPKELKSTVGFE